MEFFKKCEGVCLIVTRDKITRSKSNQMKYKKLKKLPDAKSPIQTIGAGSGYNKSLLHHKFLVGLDERKKPIWVINGSFNFTKSAVNHLENTMIIENEDVAKLFKYLSSNCIFNLERNYFSFRTIF